MSGESQMPVIHFLMEFRLRPLAGTGEDWVSLVIPYNSASSTQSYLLRGLTPGTGSYFLLGCFMFFKFNLGTISTVLCRYSRFSTPYFIIWNTLYWGGVLFPIQSICLSGFKLRIKFIPEDLSHRESLSSQGRHTRRGWGPRLDTVCRTSRPPGCSPPGRPGPPRGPWPCSCPAHRRATWVRTARESLRATHGDTHTAASLKIPSTQVWRKVNKTLCNRYIWINLKNVELLAPYQQIPDALEILFAFRIINIQRRADRDQGQPRTCHQQPADHVLISIALIKSVSF